MGGLSAELSLSLAAHVDLLLRPASSSLVLLLILPLLFSGPGLSLDLPGTRVQGIFFAEWKFIRFIVEVALPFSVTTAGLCLWLNHKQHKP